MPDAAMTSTSTPAPKKKVFIPLENNPAVFSQLAQSLGVNAHLGFTDVYSINDPDLLAFIPRPAYALLFTAPQPVFERARNEEKANMPAYEGFGKAEPVIWFRQTIGHACGLIALLHGLSNGGTEAYVEPGSKLEKILQQAIRLKPTERAQVLYDSKELEEAHHAAGLVGDTEAPPTEAPNGNHFICFVKGRDGHLWELNGGMKGPLDRGELSDDEDVLSERALDLSVRPFMKHATSDDNDFSLVAMTPVLN